ncbi:MAG: CooT family nickel-binding protein, partial [Candidatus Bathyarchaeota archaeon]|nr:CooT family nickel-binding protein [Candidatus Termiticorpusculum sp.]
VLENVLNKGIVVVTCECIFFIIKTHTLMLAVVLDGQKIFNDVIHAKVENNTVAVKNYVGESKVYNNVKITEIDITTTRIFLETVKT